jgi:hypothetical protein
MQMLRSDTLTVSKSALPQPTEIKVLQSRGVIA